MNRTCAADEVDVGDTSLQLRTRGSGPAIILLHGFPDTLDTFDTLARGLAADGFRSVQVAMRGYSPSAVPVGGAYDAITLGTDVLRVIEHCGAPATAVIGHDWGAVAAYSAAQQAPDCMRRLITAAVPHPRRFLRPTAAQLKRSWYMGYFQLHGRPESAILSGGLIDRLWADWSPGLDGRAHHLSSVHANFSTPERVRAALAYYRALPGTLLRSVSPRFRSLLGPVRVPTTVIAGADDGCIGPEMFAAQDALFPNGYRLEILAGAGHFMHLEQPDRFAAIVRDSLG